MARAYGERLRARRVGRSCKSYSPRIVPARRWSNQPTAAPTAASTHHTAMKPNQSTRRLRPTTLVHPGSVHLITVANMGAKSISATVAMTAPRRAAHQPLRGRDGATRGRPSRAPATAAASPGNPRKRRKETGLRLRARTGPNHAAGTSTPASPKATAGDSRAHRSTRRAKLGACAVTRAIRDRRPMPATPPGSPSPRS